MLRSMRRTIWSFALLILLPAGLAAQNYVYTNNDLYNGNSISAFSADTNGALSEIDGSPFATGGDGIQGFPYSSPLYSANRIIVVNNFLYASNAASNNVSAFTIDTGTGVLTAVAGSPFSTNAFDDSTHSGISLAATPDGKYLYAGSTGFLGQITIFSIDSAGALTMVGTSPVAAGGLVYGMKVSPDGKFLAIALYQTSQIAVFAIQSDGTLQAVANSPFALGSGSPTSLDINCADNLLFAGGYSENIYAFNIAPDGQLTGVTGSPFATGLTSNQVVALSSDDSILFSSNQGAGTVSAFNVGAEGSVATPGTSVSAAGGPTGGLAVGRDGTLLYSADASSATYANGQVSSFVLGGSSPLTFGAVISTTPGSQLPSVAAYPAKTCSRSTSSSGLTDNLQIFAGPPPGFDLEATLVLDSGLVVDPLTQPVTIQIGTFALNLPAGSFKAFQNGTHSSIYLFQGVINSTTLKVQITPLGQNQFQISAYDKQIDLTNLVNQPVSVTVGIGGNSASTIDPPLQTGSAHGNWRNH
jgi:6-phosphogluconolactonase